MYIYSYVRTIHLVYQRDARCSAEIRLDGSVARPSPSVSYAPAFGDPGRRAEAVPPWPSTNRWSVPHVSDNPPHTNWTIELQRYYEVALERQ
jgi:hypothetical protein